MKDQETVQKFVELRAQGWSFVRIAAELGVAKSTLTEWSRKFRFEINNRRAVALDDLQDRVLGTVQSRVAGLADTPRSSLQSAFVQRAERNRRDAMSAGSETANADFIPVLYRFWNWVAIFSTCLHSFLPTVPISSCTLKSCGTE